MNQKEVALARVDVIVPCYNYGHYLTGCVESILGQEGVDVRILILDDASPDQTAQVGEQLSRGDLRIEYRRHGVNRGHIATYNEGLEWASAEYLLLLSADDLLVPGALFRATQVMQAHGDVALTYGKEIRTAAPLAETYCPPESYSCGVLTGRQFITACCKECDNIVPTPTAVVRTAVQRQIGGYRKDLPHAGDLEMWLRFASKGAVAVLDCVQAYYRIHEANMSRSFRGISDLMQVRAAFEALFASKALNDTKLCRLARRNLACRFFWLAHRLFDTGKTTECEECLRHVLETYPSLRYEPQWFRFRCKRMMGQALWSAVGPLLRHVRTTTARLSA
ncbi:MAG TPA: glycosyltransferase family 2 protein [Gemmataceae bacterium]|nr:glycosyltransferase family 2 protein [Gemmataceae bacterium]